MEWIYGRRKKTLVIRLICCCLALALIFSNGIQMQAAKKMDAAKSYYEYLEKLEKKEKKWTANAVTTKDLSEAASKSYRMWDDELNSIYKKLKAKLSKKKFQKLQLEQKKWIAYKEKEVEKVRKEWSNSSGQDFVLNSVATGLTKKRVYELAEIMFGKKAVFKKKWVNGTCYINGTDEFAYEFVFAITKKGDIVFTLHQDGTKILTKSKLTIVNQCTLNYKNTDQGWDINLIWDRNTDWTFTITGKTPGYDEILGCEFGEPNKLNAS